MPKTLITNKQFYENRNTSDILQRLVILGLLRVLNKQLVYQQIWDDTAEGIENITVPFFYDFVGATTTSERFILDNYNNWTDDECTSAGIKKFDGDFKPIPYGVITLSSTSIDAGNISNRFVMGRYTRKENNELKSYVSFLYSIPLTMNFSVNIKCDTMNTAWKIELAYREFFYKNKTFHVNYRGTVVPVRVGFPESLTLEKTTTYQYGQTNDGFDIKIMFDLACETYQPVFDPLNERRADNTIKNLIYTVSNQKESLDQNYAMQLEAVSNLTKMCVTSGEDIILQWKNFDVYNDITFVDILYQTEDDPTFKLIESVLNNNFYHWIVPDNILEDPVIFDIIYPNVENVVMHNTPIIKIYPNPNSRVIDETCVSIISKGLFFSDVDEYAIPAFLSYENKHGEIIDKEFFINIKNGAVDEASPIHIEPFVYDGELKFKRINIIVRCHDKNDTAISFIDNPDDISNWVTIC